MVLAINFASVSFRFIRIIPFRCSTSCRLILTGWGCLVELSFDGRMLLVDRARFLSVSCVYFVWFPYDPPPDILLYVGATNNLRRRWRNHQRWNEIGFVEEIYLTWLRCQESRLAALEDYYIRTLKPELNGARVPSAADIEVDMENHRTFKAERLG